MVEPGDEVPIQTPHLKGRAAPQQDPGAAGAEPQHTPHGSLADAEPAESLPLTIPELHGTGRIEDHDGAVLSPDGGRDGHRRLLAREQQPPARMPDHLVPVAVLDGQPRRLTGRDVDDPSAPVVDEKAAAVRAETLQRHAARDLAEHRPRVEVENPGDPLRTVPRNVWHDAHRHLPARWVPSQHLCRRVEAQPRLR